MFARPPHRTVPRYSSPVTAHLYTLSLSNDKDKMRFDTCITLLSLLALSPLSVLGAPAPVPQEGAATSAAASGSGSGTCSRRQGGRPGGGRGGLNRDRPTESPASNAGDTSAVSPTSTSTPAADAETTAEAEGTTEVVQSSAADSAAAPEVTIADTQHLATAGLTPAGFGSGSGGGEGQGQPGSGSGSGGGEGQGQPEGGNNDAGGDQGQASGTYSPLSQAPAQTQAAPPAESAAGGGEGEGSDSGSGSGSASGGFEQDILQAHNDYRAKFSESLGASMLGVSTEYR